MELYYARYDGQSHTHSLFLGSEVEIEYIILYFFWYSCSCIHNFYDTQI